MVCKIKICNQANITRKGKTILINNKFYNNTHLSTLLISQSISTLPLWKYKVMSNHKCFDNALNFIIIMWQYFGAHYYLIV